MEGQDTPDLMPAICLDTATIKNSRENNQKNGQKKSTCQDKPDLLPATYLEISCWHSSSNNKTRTKGQSGQKKS